ncbi:acyl-CoA carboxylase subunit beta [Thermodesulfobacteriota bacterium]
MNWNDEIKEIANRRQLAQGLGGEENVALQHSRGKLNARERVDRILDKGSFREIGTLTGHALYDDNGRIREFTPANVVIGQGMVDNRRVVVAAEDFSVRGGSSEATISEKWLWSERLALEMKQPLIRLVDTAGGSVKLIEKQGATKIPGYPDWPFSPLLGQVPVTAIALGPVAGLGAFRVVCSHFSVMVKEISQVFAAGPPLVEPATGQSVTKEDLGGYGIHTRGSGVVDNDADTEEDAFRQLRSFLSYLPTNVYETPPIIQADDDPERREEELLSIIPHDRRKTYDPRRIIELVFDQGSAFEMGRFYGRSVLSFFCRLSGMPAGVMISDPRHFGGGMTASSAEKIIRFVDLCDTFHLPIINFVDQPGVVVGLKAEKQGTIRYAVRALQAIEQSRVPWVAIIIRRVFGVAGSSYGRLRDLNLRYAWPSAQWGSLPIEGGVRAAYKREIETSDDPESRTRELENYYEQLQSPFRTAERFGILDIIDPRETRPLLCDWIEQAYRILPRQLGATHRTMRV